MLSALPLEKHTVITDRESYRMSELLNDNWHTEAILSLLKTKEIRKGAIETLLRTLLDESRNIPFPSNLEELSEIIPIERTAKFEKKASKVPRNFTLDAGNTGAQEILRRSEEHEIQILDWFSDLFPVSLKQIPHPPIVLYARGNTSLLKTINSIAVIGTRNPTEYGRDISHRFGYRLGQKGIVVVGGLAKGCDTAAHRGCLDAGGHTLAILANGLDSIYPHTNANLAQDIINSKGCLLSEYEPGVKAAKYQFVERDRLQSGISKAVIVVETGKEGGTMHTATFATKQARDLRVVRFPQDKVTVEQQGGYARLINEFKAIPIDAENEDELDRFVAAVEQPTTIKGKNKNQTSISDW